MSFVTLTDFVITSLWCKYSGDCEKVKYMNYICFNLKSNN